MLLNPESKDVIIHKLGDATLNPILPQKTKGLPNPFLNKLIHAAGHDLRSPMFVIRSYSQLLQQTQEKERLKRGFKLIADATVTMESTINSLVQLMDIYTQSVPDDESLFFKDIFEQAKIQLYNEIQEFQPTFETDFQTCPKIRFSSVYLKEIMTNIIDNSMRHNSGKKDLVITIKTYKKKNKIVLQISDNGKGVKDSMELEKIKQPFYSMTDDSKCTGIGLSKVQAIAQVNASNFEIINQPIEGMISRFHF